MLQIILLKTIYLSKRTTNLNKNSEINQNLNIFRKNNIIVKLEGIDAISYIQMITKLTRYCISEIICLTKTK